MAKIGYSLPLEFTVYELKRRFLKYMNQKVTQKKTIREANEFMVQLYDCLVEETNKNKLPIFLNSFKDIEIVMESLELAGHKTLASQIWAHLILYFDTMFPDWIPTKEVVKIFEIQEITLRRWKKYGAGKIIFIEDIHWKKDEKGKLFWNVKKIVRFDQHLNSL